MKFVRLVLALWMALGGRQVLADEGMWQPSQLAGMVSAMKARGIEVDAAQLSDLKTGPAGAVVSLAGCTASFVSADGLLLTNQHCVESALQFNSSAQHNLIDKGFFAATRADELPAGPRERALLTVGIRDVTAAVDAAAATASTASERYEAIEAEKRRLSQTCEKPGYRCDVISFDDGAAYKLIEQLELADLRLVYVPPNALAQYGGDADNFQWPRYCADFAFLRAYVGKYGVATAFARDAVPYRPSRWLSIDAAGIRAGDPVIVMGFPGLTRRHELPESLKNDVEWRLPFYRAMLSAELAVTDAATASDPQARIKYAVFQVFAKNAIKELNGELAMLSNQAVLQRRDVEERAFERWLDSNASDGQIGPEELARLKAVLAQQRRYQEKQAIFGFMRRTGMFDAAYRIVRLAFERQKPESIRTAGYRERDLPQLISRETDLQRTVDFYVDQKLLVLCLMRYRQLPSDQHSPALDRWLAAASDQDAIARKVAQLYAGSGLFDPQIRIHWLHASAQQVETSADPWMRLMTALMPGLLADEEVSNSLEARRMGLYAMYVKALGAYDGSRGKTMYADANSTLRIAFGKVSGYAATNGVRSKPFTTVASMRSTGQTNINPIIGTAPEFLQRKHKLSHIAIPGSLNVDFLSTTDITAGNSGSPTLDGRGSLVGLAFDGTWESLGSPWIYDQDKSRAIHVDVRYILWIMRHLAHADRIVDELGLGRPREAKR
jgi:hypothetical protein